LAVGLIGIAALRFQRRPAVYVAPPEQTARLDTTAAPPVKPESVARHALPSPADPGKQVAPPLTPTELLAQHYTVAGQIGTPEQTSAAYEASIAALRPHAKEVVFALYDEFKTAESGSLQRYSAVKTLGDLVAPEAYEALLDIARSPLPRAPGAVDHAGDPLVDERIVRLEAASGLARLADADFEPAAHALYQLAVEPTSQRSLRLSAISGFIGSGPDAPKRAEQLRAHLPEALQSAAVPAPSQAEATAAYLAMPVALPE